MTNEQNIALVAKYREAESNSDDGAMRRIAEAIVAGNEGLVRKLATRWARPQTDEDLDDAMQAARMGILRSLKDFDPKLGSFSTHAGSHIRDYVQRWSGKTVSVARPRSAQMPASVAHAASKFRMRTGKEPTASDLGITFEQFTEWSSGTHFVEIDDSDEERPRVELTYDAEECENTTRRMQLDASWNEAIEDLSPRNQIIAERVLMNGEAARDVGADFGLTHSRVVQICKRIETRLRRALNPDAYDRSQNWELKAAERERERYSRRTA